MYVQVYKCLVAFCQQEESDVITFNNLISVTHLQLIIQNCSEAPKLQMSCSI